MIRSPTAAHDFLAGEASAAGSRAGRDFIGTISTSASVKSLWTTFTFSKESSTCTAVGVLFVDGSASRKIETGLNLLTQVDGRAGPAGEATGIGAEIFCVLPHGNDVVALTSSAGFWTAGLADSAGAAGLANGFLGETNCGR